MLSHKLVFSESMNFTSGRWILAPPTVPINHYFRSRNQQNKAESPILLFHANIFNCNNACLEHSNFLTVNDQPNDSAQSIKARRRFSWRFYGADAHVATLFWPQTAASGAHKSNYELFNCNNFNIRYWSWYYRGCWHQTCPPMDPR